MVQKCPRSIYLITYAPNVSFSLKIASPLTTQLYDIQLNVIFGKPNSLLKDNKPEL